MTDVGFDLADSGEPAPTLHCLDGIGQLIAAAEDQGKIQDVDDEGLDHLPETLDADVGNPPNIEIDVVQEDGVVSEQEMVVDGQEDLLSSQPESSIEPSSDSLFDVSSSAAEHSNEYTDNDVAPNGSNSSFAEPAGFQQVNDGNDDDDCSMEPNFAVNGDTEDVDRIINAVKDADEELETRYSEEITPVDGIVEESSVEELSSSSSLQMLNELSSQVRYLTQ